MQRKFPRICAVLLESYSISGLHRHHNEHKNYEIVSSDESQFLLTNIRKKEGRNERECALINKLWDGQGDKTTLKDSDCGSQSTSFSMIIFIQPQHLINEIMSMGEKSNRFYDRFIFIVEKLKSTEQRQAVKTLNKTIDTISSSNYTPKCVKSTNPCKLPTTSQGTPRLTKILLLMNMLGILTPSTELSVVSIIWPDA